MPRIYRSLAFLVSALGSSAFALGTLTVEPAQVGQKVLILSVDDSIRIPDLSKLRIDGYEIENAVFVEDLADSIRFSPNYLDLTTLSNGRVLEFAPSQGQIILETQGAVLPQVGTILSDTSFGGLFRRVVQVESQAQFAGSTRRWVLKTVEAELTEAIVKCDVAFQTRLDLNLSLPTLEKSGEVMGATSDGSPVLGRIGFNLRESQLLFQPMLTGRLRITNGQVEIFQTKLAGNCEISAIAGGGVTGTGRFEWEGELPGRQPQVISLGSGLFIKVRNRPFIHLQAVSRKKEFWAEADFRIQNSLRAELGYGQGQWKPMAENKTTFAGNPTRESRGDGELKLSIRPRLEFLWVGKQGPGFTFEAYAKIQSMGEEPGYNPLLGRGPLFGKEPPAAGGEAGIPGSITREFSLGTNILMDSRTNFTGAEVLKKFVLFNREQLLLSPPREGSLTLKETDSNRIYLQLQTFPKADYYVIQQKAGMGPWETVMDRASAPKMRLGNLKPSTAYRFRAIGINAMGMSSAFPPEGIPFTTPAPNHPPFPPLARFPDSGAMVQDSVLALTWKGGDPDVGGKVTYDLYLDTRFPPLRIFAGSLGDTVLKVGELRPATLYYWKVVAFDGMERTEGTVRSFTYRPRTIPEPGSPKAGPFPYPMAFVPKGSFQRDDGKLVQVGPFLMGKFEVTQAEFQKVLRRNPSYRLQDSLPVERVTWDEAEEYCRETGGRLPTEAEWEYAARGGNTAAYYWGKEDPKDFAWYRENSENRSQKVGLKKPNGWGLHDMAGNVFEWVQDWYGEYSPRELDHPRGPASGVSKVIRGASWYSEPNTLSLMARFSNRPGFRNFKVGFRCMREVEGLSSQAAPADPLAAKEPESHLKPSGAKPKP